MLEEGLARAMCNAIGLAISGRERCGSPNVAGFFISQVECFTRWVACWIVRPGFEAVFTAIHRPGTLAAGFADHKTKIWITDYVYPWGRSMLTRAQLNDIFAAICTKTAITVKKLQGFYRRKGILPPGNEKAFGGP